MSVDPVGFVDTGDTRYFNRYAYTANDPVNRIDADGRKFGFLPNESPENQEHFQKIIDKVGKTDSIFKDRLTTLWNSDHLHIIGSPTAAANSTSKTTRKAGKKAPINVGEGPKKNESNGTGTGSLTVFDPTATESGTTLTGKPFTSTPEATFVHEFLDHAYQKNQGTIDRTKVNGVPKHEQDAVDFADKYNEKVDDPLRKDY